MIDYKGLAGDPSDNIPGVKGIGQKTAMTLLQKYDTVEDIYEHIDELKGATKDKMIADKAAALTSKEIATIYLEVPINTDFEEMKYTGPDDKKLYEIFKLADGSIVCRCNFINECLV